MAIKYKHGIARGMPEGCFRHLSLADKIGIVKLLSRGSESGFRRGLQHGEYFTKHTRKLYISPLKLRGEQDYRLDEAPWVNSPAHGTTSVERLVMEHGELEYLGLADAIRDVLNQHPFRPKRRK